MNMLPGFQSKNFKVATQDGRNFVLLEDVIYVTREGIAYTLPAGATSDGASTPQEIWLNFPPFGSYWQAAFLHDCAYRNTLLIAATSNRAELTKPLCDNLLLEAMELAGTHEFTRRAIYNGVVFGGEHSFDGDRKNGWQSYMVEIASLI